MPCPLDEWLNRALMYPGVRLVPLSKYAAVESCRLPGEYHKDPADRMLVAAALELDCPLVTADGKILFAAGLDLALKLWSMSRKEIKIWILENGFIDCEDGEIVFNRLADQYPVEGIAMQVR